MGLALSGIWPVIEKEKLNGFRSGTGIIFIASAVITVLGNLALWRQNLSMKKLQKEVARLENLLGNLDQDYFQTFDNELGNLFEELKLTNSDRISLYRHNGDNFIMIGRYAKNPNYCRRGRVIYPDSQGCIGKAWSEEQAFAIDLPDPLTDEALYIFRMKNLWMMNEETTRSLTMKSRNYAAYAIDNLNKPAQRIAVIVFESLDSNRFTDTTLPKSTLADKLKTIRQLLETLKSLEPSLNRAREEGY